MNEHGFDEVSRRFSEGATRRGVLGLLAGLTAPGLGPEGAAATAPQRQRQQEVQSARYCDLPRCLIVDGVVAGGTPSATAPTRVEPTRRQ